MTRYLTLQEVLDIHRWALQAFGGPGGIRDVGLVESALAAPQMTFDGVELHSTLVEKAAALAFSLVMNHGFVDGNKRVGFWSMDTFLRLNGQGVVCTAEEGEQTFLSLAAGEMTREQLTDWLSPRCRPLSARSEASESEADDPPTEGTCS
jgi:death-on-curing protein